MKVEGVFLSESSQEEKKTCVNGVVNVNELIAPVKDGNGDSFFNLKSAESLELDDDGDFGIRFSEQDVEK